MNQLNLLIGTCLLFAGIGTFLIQLYLWLAHQVRALAPLSYFWELVGFVGPLRELPLAGVFMLLGGWLAWEGMMRRAGGAPDI